MRELTDADVEKLDELMGRALRRLTLLSDGKCSLAADARGGASGKAGDKILHLGQQDWAWEIRSLRNRYTRASAPETKRDILTETLTTLVRAKYAPQGRGLRGTKEWREKIARDPRRAEVVAIVFEVGRQSVFNYRNEFKRRAA